MKDDSSIEGRVNIMGAIFNNLKPFIAYWVSFAVYVMISLFEIFSSKNLIIAFFIVYIILSVLIGYSTDIKEIRFGIILFELQLIICAIIFSINTESSGLNTFVSAGNIFYSTFFERINNIFNYILSIFLPVLLLGIGFGLTELKNKRKKQSL